MESPWSGTASQGSSFDLLFLPLQMTEQRTGDLQPVSQPVSSLTDVN